MLPIVDNILTDNEPISSSSLLFNLTANGYIIANIIPIILVYTTFGFSIYGKNSLAAISLSPIPIAPAKNTIISNLDFSYSYLSCCKIFNQIKLNNIKINVRNLAYSKFWNVFLYYLTNCLIFILLFEYVHRLIVVD